jgi:hypothetical protein
MRVPQWAGGKAAVAVQNEMRAPLQEHRGVTNLLEHAAEAGTDHLEQGGRKEIAHGMRVPQHHHRQLRLVRMASTGLELSAAVDVGRSRIHIVLGHVESRM